GADDDDRRAPGPRGAGRRLRGRGGGRWRTDPAPGDADHPARSLGGADRGDQQAGVLLRDLDQRGDVLPPDPAGPPHLPAADARGLRRLLRRCPRGVDDAEERLRPDHPGRARARGLLRVVQAERGGADEAAVRGRAAPLDRARDRPGGRLLRRLHRPRDGIVLRLRPRRPARLQLPRGLREGQARQLGDQPGGPGRLRAPGRGAVGAGPADGGRQHHRWLRRRARRGRQGLAVRADLLPRGRVRARPAARRGPARCGL
ncbi:MAG: hypothetical protein AVDCRST_MAG60-2274, partial [uncultured Nocardioides sp.]